MIFILMQEGGMDYGLVVPLILAPIIFVILEVIVLKIGLKISKAMEKTDFKWILISIGIQTGLVFFVFTPVMFMGISGSFNDQGPDPGIMIPVMITAIIVGVNMINVLHQIGIGKSIFVFILYAIPLTFFIITLVSTLNSIN